MKRNVSGHCLLIIISAVFSIFASSSASAYSTVVDLNAYFNDYGIEGIIRPESVALDLSAGTYTITPVDKAHGGQYTAWNCSYGLYYMPMWVNNYYWSLDGENYANGGDGGTYWSAEEAFAHAGTASFTLSSPGTLFLRIDDSAFWDNLEGMSVQVSDTASNVPVPGALFLFAPGLLGLAAARRSSRS